MTDFNFKVVDASGAFKRAFDTHKIKKDVLIPPNRATNIQCLAKGTISGLAAINSRIGMQTP